MKLFTKIMGVAMLCLIAYFVIDMGFIARQTTDTYIITRTSSYPPTVKKISKEYKEFDNNQFVPIKGYSRIGVKYLCTIELVDSTFLVDFTNEFLGNFHYESLRFFVWNLIEISKDSTFEPIRWINGEITLSYNNQKSTFLCKGSTVPLEKCTFVNRVILSELPDTIEYRGVKVYDIETYSVEKFMENFDALCEITQYESERYEGKQTY